MSRTRTVTVYHSGDKRPYTVIQDVVTMSGLNGNDRMQLTVGNGNKYTFMLRNTVSVEEEWDEDETT